jgi:phosphoenolpyruvate carboxylase
MEENNYDELDEIFVDKNVLVDKKLVVEILKPFVTIDNEGILDFTEEYEKLNENKRALVYFVAKKAMVIREIPEIIESVGPTELSKKAHISESSAKHAIFRDYKKILKKEKSGYIIPNHKLKQIKELIFQNGD